MRMNEQQKAYALAKAKAGAVDAQQTENEARFIRESGYTNADGTIPSAIYMVDDDDAFTQLSEKFERSDLNVYDDLKKAMEELKAAEDNLIDYALSIIPEDVAATLDAHRSDPKIREQLLDKAYRLDPNTVPAIVREA